MTRAHVFPENMTTTRGWSCQFLSYIAAQDLRMKELTVLASTDVVPVLQASAGEDQPRGRTLCYLLKLFLETKSVAFKKLRVARDDNGSRHVDCWWMSPSIAKEVDEEQPSTLSFPRRSKQA